VSQKKLKKTVERFSLFFAGDEWHLTGGCVTFNDITSMLKTQFV